MGHKPMSTIPATMRAALLIGNGDLDMLEVRDDIAVPQPQTGEVLIKVHACGINNTDVNTRIGWYSKSVSGATSGSGSESSMADVEDDASWGGNALNFPLIQGMDVVGTIAALGDGVDPARIGQRILIDPCLRDPNDPGDLSKTRYFGSECNGGFAQYTTVAASNAHAIESPLSHAELATFPCSWTTAEHMLSKARLQDGETVVVTGASGGVGSALVQLAKRRKAHVIAIAGASKLDLIRGIGADSVISRDSVDLSSLTEVAPQGGIDVAADVVGGAGFDVLVAALRHGGRYVTAGAIAGPIVELDLRTLYLHDLELLGATVHPPETLKNLIGYIERGEVRPLLAGTFALEHIGKAQTEFLKKQHVGNFVIDMEA